MGETMRCTWSDEIDYELCDCVTATWAAIMAPLKATGYTQDQFFWFVAGRLYHGTGHVATGPACAKRWSERRIWYHEEMRARMEAQEAAAKDKAERVTVDPEAAAEFLRVARTWEEAEQMAEQAEQGLAEWTADCLAATHSDVTAIGRDTAETLRLVQALCAAWEVE